jgi:hypothetical protein
VRPARGHALLHHRAMRHAGYPIQEVRAHTHTHTHTETDTQSGPCLLTLPAHPPPVATPHVCTIVNVASCDR